MVEGVRGDFFIVAVVWLLVVVMFGYGETMSMVDVVM